MAKDLGSMVARMQADVSRWNSGIDKANTRLSRMDKSTRRTAKGIDRLNKKANAMGTMLKGMAVAFVTTKLTGFVNNVFDAADALGKFATSTTMSVESLQRWQFAAEQSGVQTGMLRNAINTFAKRLGEARIGTGAMATKLKEMNPELLEQLKQTDNVNDAMLLYADALNDIDDPMDQANFAAAGFSKTLGGKMIPLLKNGSEGIINLGKELDSTGSIMSDKMVRDVEAANDAMNKLNKHLKGSAQVAVAEWAPAFEVAARTMTSIMAEGLGNTEKEIEDFGDTSISTWDALIKAFAVMVDVFRTGFHTIGTAFQLMGKTFGAGGAALVQLMKGNLGLAKRIAEEWKADMGETFNDAFAQFDTQAFSKRLERIRNEVADDSAMRQLQRSIDETIRKNEELFGSQLRVTESVEETGEAAQDTERSYGRIVDTMVAMGKQVPEIEAGTGRIAIETSKVKEEVEATDDKMVDLWRSTDQIAKDTITGVRDAWVGMWEGIFSGDSLKSVDNFLKSVKNMFLKVAAEIAASWTASKLFGMGDFSIGDIFGGSGGGGGLLNLSSIGGGLKKLFSGGGGSGGGAETFALGEAAKKIAPSAILRGGGIEAGTGLLAKAGGAFKASGAMGAVEAGTGATAAGSGFSSAIAAAAPAAAVVAMPFVMKELFGGGNLDKLMSKAAKALPNANMQSVSGDLAGGAGGGFGFAQGQSAGFAGEFAQMEGFSDAVVKMNDQLTAFKGVTMPETLNMLNRANQKFVQLSETGAEVFAGMGVDATQMGIMLKDGVINETEKARIGFQNLGNVIENPKTGVKELGAITLKQFDQIMAAVKKGELRMSALTGETKLTQKEMQTLGSMGVGAHGKIVAAANSSAAAEKSFGDRSNQVFSMVKKQSAAAAKSFGTSFATEADRAASSISSMASRATHDFSNMSTAARNLAKRMGEIPRTVNVDVNQRVRRTGGRLPQAQHGGVFSGPRSGYPVELHGNEAVIPLKNGRVPVEISGGGGQGMVVNITQNVHGGDPEQVRKATRQALQEVADEFPMR